MPAAARPIIHPRKRQETPPFRQLSMVRHLFNDFNETVQLTTPASGPRSPSMILTKTTSPRRVLAKSRSRLVRYFYRHPKSGVASAHGWRARHAITVSHAELGILTRTRHDLNPGQSRVFYRKEQSE